jgi:hypothetical protein
MTANLPLDTVSPISSLLADGPVLAASRPPYGWFAQLRSHYPTASLVSELLQIHTDRFVVRALVQVEGVTVLTAMATAVQLEVAEDMAQFRALMSLGLVVLPTGMLPPDHTVPPTKKDEAIESQAAVMNAEPISPEAIDTSPTLPMITAPPLAKSTKSKVPPAQSAAIVEPEPPLNQAVIANRGPVTELSPVAERETATPVDFSSSPDPIDLSDAIAQIGAEIERIGWNKKQGSAHLQKTYSKRTRAELTEEELLEFLSYLKSLPSKHQAELSPVPF